jgi:hypothetical protein
MTMTILVYQSWNFNENSTVIHSFDTRHQKKEQQKYSRLKIEGMTGSNI